MKFTYVRKFFPLFYFRKSILKIQLINEKSIDSNNSEDLRKLFWDNRIFSIDLRKLFYDS